MQFLKKNYGLLIILILSIWAIQPFFVSGFFPMHDDTQVARVFEMGKVLRAGIFPVRVVPDLGYGYGYPIFNFYAPLAYYAGGLFVLLGLDALAATKLMMVQGIILAGVSMYFLARKFFGELGGAVSGLFYLYAPYHAVDVYVRGDVAEFWAYAFIPLMFFGFHELFQSLSSDELKIDNSKFKIQNSKLQFKINKSGALGSIGFAGVILSHNLTALMVTPFLLVVCLMFVIFSKKDTRIRNTLYVILYALLGLATSAFYWIPALLEMNQTNVLSQIGGGADFRDHFVCLSQFWSSQWGFGGSTGGCIDGMSFMIGKLHILAVITSAVALIYIKLKQESFDKKYYSQIFGVVGFFFSIFIMLGISRFIWEGISIMNFFQYPWRFLILATFFSSFLAGSLVALSVKFGIRQYLVALPLIFFLLFFNQKLFVPQTIFPKTASDYTSEYALKWIASKTSDEYLSPDFKKPNNPNDVNRGSVDIRIKETPIERASNVISIGGLLALILGIILVKGKLKHE